MYWRIRPTGNAVAAAVLLSAFLSGCMLVNTWAADSRRFGIALAALYILAWVSYGVLFKTPWTEVGKRCALMTVTLAGLLALLELPARLRFVDYRQVFSTPGFPFWWNRPGHITDPELLWVPEPHYRFRGKFTRGDLVEFLCLPSHPPEEFDVRYDANGFRNNTDMTAADIAVVGDSYVEGPMVSSEVLMTTVLANLQKRTVVNLGLSGYGPRQELVALQRYALPLNPHAIVWVFYEGNDLEDAHAYDSTVPYAAQFVHTHWERSFTRNAMLAVLRLAKSRGCTPRPEFIEHY